MTVRYNIFIELVENTWKNLFGKSISIVTHILSAFLGNYNRKSF